MSNSRFADYMPCYSTEGYDLFVGDFPDEMVFTYNSVEFLSGYFVVNSDTDIVEYVAIQYPDAMMAMHMLQKTCDERPWEVLLLGIAPNGEAVH